MRRESNEKGWLLLARLGDLLQPRLDDFGTQQYNNPYNRGHEHKHSHTFCLGAELPLKGISQFKSPCDGWLSPTAGCLSQLKEVRVLARATREKEDSVRRHPYIYTLPLPEPLIDKQGRLPVIAACRWSRGGVLHKKQ